MKTERCFAEAWQIYPTATLFVIVINNRATMIANCRASYQESRRGLVVRQLPWQTADVSVYAFPDSSICLCQVSKLFLTRTKRRNSRETLLLHPSISSSFFVFSRGMLTRAKGFYDFCPELGAGMPTVTSRSWNYRFLSLKSYRSSIQI